MPRLRPRRPAVLLGLLLLGAPAPEAGALLLFAEGELGSLAAPVEREAGPSAAGPVTLASMPIGADGRTADVTAFVDAGVVQLSASVAATAGAASVGNWEASASGSWEDTITFSAPGMVPGLPGVEIVPGVTAGTAELVVQVEGLLDVLADNAIARARWSARMGYGILAPFADRPFGPTFTDFRGSVQKSGELDSFGLDGDALPEELRLVVSFVFGEAFDVLFELDAGAEIGWEGAAPGALHADALLDQSAVWQGPQNVAVLVDDGAGGTTPVMLPAGFWSFASPTQDYTEPLPEPASALLTALGLALAARGARPRP